MNLLYALSFPYYLLNIIIHTYLSCSCMYVVVTIFTFTSYLLICIFLLLLLQEEMAKHTTPMYRAPEMLDTWNHYSIHTPSDIWALGCLLYFLCFGRHPFEDSAKLAILNGNFKIPENDITFDAFHDLIRQMLVVDPGFRPSINQVQEHLAEICSTYGFDVNGELDLELESLTVMSESVSSESLSNSASTATSDATVCHYYSY